MNRTLTLVRYAKLDTGWRRGAVVMQRNGKLKHPCIVVGKQEADAPQGRYQIVRYDGKTPVYTDLGNDPTDALARFRSEEKKQNARLTADDAGMEIAEPEPETQAKPKTLRQYAAEFIRMHKSLPHRSDDSVRVYTQITTAFLAQSKAGYPDDVTQADVIGWYGWMKDKGYSDRTRSNLYQSLRGWLRYCGLDPSKVIDRGTHTLMLKYTKRTPNMYDAETVAKLIEHANDPDEALLWNLAYKTGLRESELRMLTRHDLHGLNTSSPILHVRERDEYGRRSNWN
jgi:integrase